MVWLSLMTRNMPIAKKPNTSAKQDNNRRPKPANKRDKNYSWPFWDPVGSNHACKIPTKPGTYQGYSER